MYQATNIGILGVGTYLPEIVRRNDWWPASVVEKWLERKSASLLHSEQVDPTVSSGVRRSLEAMAALKEDPFRGAVERRVMPDGMVASDMEAFAGKEALDRAGVSAADIGVLLVNSQLPDYLSVANAPVVHHKLGLPEKCLSVGIEGACNSFLQQLALAEQMIRSGQARYALLIQSSGYLHLAKKEEPHSAWFGDAATAVVLGAVGPGNGILGRSHRTDGSLFKALVTGCRGTRWYQGEPVYLYSEDSKAARTMVLRLADMGKQVVDEALAEAGYSATDVHFYASHQATQWFRRVTQEHIGLANAQFVDTFAWTASLAASSIPFCLAVGEKEGRLKTGDLVAMFSGGSGIVWSAVVLRWGSG